MLPAMNTDNHSAVSPQNPQPSLAPNDMLPSSIDHFDLSSLPSLPDTSATSSVNPSEPANATSTREAEMVASTAPIEEKGSGFSLKDDNTSPYKALANQTSTEQSSGAAASGAAASGAAASGAAAAGASTSTEASAATASATASATPADAPTPVAKPDKQRLPTKLPVDFIDIYAILGMERDAKFSDLRKRIAEMYLDSQKNLDHRNAKKKLEYQQLFEVTLPQARHLLLDPERRTEYDKYLDDHREDQGHRALAEQVLSNGFAGDRVQSVEEAAKRARAEEEKLSPEQLAERRTMLWKKWEESLASAHDPLAELKFSMPELQQRAIVRKEYMEHALIEVTENDRRRQEEQMRRREAERLAREEEERRAREAEIEARRQIQYGETVETLVTTGRLYNGFGLGAGILVAGFALLFYFEVLFSLPGGRYPFGSADSFRMIALFLILVACVFGGWQGALRGAARIKSLVQTPAQARQNADIHAAQIVTQRFQRETSSAQNAPDQLEVDMAIRDEAMKQVRNIRRNSILLMMKRNAVSGWMFGLGEGAFVLCAGTIFLIDYVSLRGSNLPSRGTTVFFGLIFSTLIGLAAGYAGKTLGQKQRIETAAAE